MKGNQRYEITLISFHRESGSGFVRRFYEGDGKYRYKTQNSANGKCQRKIAQITQLSPQDWSEDPADSIGQEHPAIILANVF